MAVSLLNLSTPTIALGHFFCSTSNPAPSISLVNAFHSGILEGRANIRSRRIARLSAGSPLNDNQQQPEQVDVSVLRFTLGIPGLDESYLPRYLGLAFGSLIFLNHFLGSSGPPPAAQLRTEVVGLCLAAFSTVLPYLGNFLKGARAIDRSSIPEGNRQIFLMSEGLEDTLKQDLAWGSYVLLRNTNTMSVLISVRDALCVRGYWNVLEDASKSEILDWSRRAIQDIGLSNLSDTMYYPQSTDQFVGILPKGAASVLLQPLVEAPDQSTGGRPNSGFIFLVSSANFAYRDKDLVWIKAVANKFHD